MGTRASRACGVQGAWAGNMEGSWLGRGESGSGWAGSDGELWVLMVKRVYGQQGEGWVSRYLGCCGVAGGAARMARALFLTVRPRRRQLVLLPVLRRL